ncbi:MAG: hypothetical protein M1832_001281 [Thelocarpon impressellum]|nr:MAG: hypothetical protein M1832_001281 [Thelocarpon impressellum]
MDSPGNPSFESGLSDDDDELNLEETLEDEGVGWARRISELQERLVESAQGFATICDQMPGAPTILPDKETRAVIAAETQYLQATAGGEVPALPTPKEDGAEDTTTADDEFTRDDLPLARNKTPPIDSLPFLTNGPPTPVSFVDLDVIQENLDRHQTIKSSLIRAVTKQRLSVADKQEELRRTYAALYRKWRIYADGLDREAERKKIETAEPEQPAAPPEASPPAQPPASVEGRRGGKFSTELELQRILKESELAAKEAQEKADREAREAKARVDTEKEAIVPDMLDEPQRDASVFRDSNQLLDGHQALSVFRFVHPPVDFDEEEQRIFTENFLLYPKKWGKIAEAIPNRSYQECIEHYYQTKHIAKYKQKLNKRRSNKKGRKPAPSTARPKSNALMSDLGVRPELYDGDEFDTPPAAVTDSGRPRRAAAPVFGELNSEVDSNASTQAPGRKPAVTPKGDGPAENPLERGTKRGKAGATREKGAKRGRNQLLAAAPGPSPEKSTGKAKERETGRDRDQKGDDDQKIKDVDDGRSLANIQARAASLEVPPNPQDDRSGVPASSSGSPQRETSRPSRGNHRAGAQTSSYWSVPESTDFPKLLDHFGSDWQAIASHMTSKTPVMVNLVPALRSRRITDVSF